MRTSISIILSVLWTGVIFAQKYTFVPYSVKDGLCQNQVYSIDQDQDGYLWLGTAGGASKFDGENFKSYSTSNGLTDNVVKSISSHLGFTWIFTNKGLSRIRGKEVETFNLVDVLEGNYISSALVSTKRNSIMIAVKNNNLIELKLDDQFMPDLENVKSWDSPLEKGRSARSLKEDSIGNVWLAGKGFAGHLTKEGEWEELEVDSSSMNASDIAFDQQGNIWVSIYDEGIYKFKGNSIKKYCFKDGLASQLNRSLFVDSKGKVWAASKNGVTVISEKSIEKYTEKNGLPNDNIEVIFEDSEGNIWLASDGSGAFRYTSNEFVTYDESSELSTKYVMSVAQNNEGTLFFGTYGAGLDVISDLNMSNYNIENSLIPNNVVWSTLVDESDRIWLGTSKGLSVFRDGEFENYRDTKWLPSNKITSLFQTEFNDTLSLLLGTAKGLSVINLENENIRGYEFPASLKNIRTISTGINEQIWMGTSNGIYVTDGLYCEPWIYNDQLADKVIYSIQNFKDSIWFIGTANGLYQTNGTGVKKITLSDEYSANYINFLVIESDRYLWVGTNLGIYEIDLKYYLLDNQSGIINHSKNSGITSLETNLNAAFQDADSCVWMGTGDGLVKFDRKRRITEKKAQLPQTQINDARLFLKKTDWKRFTKEINKYNGLPINPTLPYRQNSISFFFDAVSLSNHKEVKYKIMLAGLDEDWSPTIDQNSFTYTNLSHGVYTFKVKSSVDGINWSAPVTFSFEISKPYYLTWWFFTLIGFFVISVVLAIWWWSKIINKRKRLTEKLMYRSKLLALEQQTLNASMNRHFIFNALNSIQYYINTQDRLSANRYLTSFAKLIRKNLDSSVSESGVVTLEDEIERLELYISLEHMRFQKKFDYSINVHPEIDTSDVQIPAMILQPFVENSIWHGILPKNEGGKISIEIFKQDDAIKFEITDNGIGIDESRANKSDHDHHSKGMLITSGRMEILKKANEKTMTIKGPYQMNDDQGNALGTKVEITLEGN